MANAVVTRFAPSPTGMLHLGGARTALFNYLFARRHGGKYLLRIEDTDRARSTAAAVNVIIDGLQWLGLHHDGAVVMQSARRARHQAAAEQLVAQGAAYYCFATPAELEELRARQAAEQIPLKYDGRWRGRPQADINAMLDKGARPTVRLAMPPSGETVIEDKVQGRVVVQNQELDDFVLLRADGTPTYMLSVVVDDIDMGITHIIRGADHLTNAFRQYHLFRALLGKDTSGKDKPMPLFAHIPLILNDAGEKLSKRHGAAAITDYQEMGILPAAMVNYLLRLGWSHGDEEIISVAQAVSWFDLGAVGQSPARTDINKLHHLNQHYLKLSDDQQLARLSGLIDKDMAAGDGDDAAEMARRLVAVVKGRVKTLVALRAEVKALLARPLYPLAVDLVDKKCSAQEQQQRVHMLCDMFAQQPLDGAFDHDTLFPLVKGWAAEQGWGMKDIAPIIRLALSGRATSPGAFELLSALGRAESLARLGAFIAARPLFAV